MTGSVTDKVVVISGGAQGIGRGLVLRFVEEGARVILADIDEASATAAIELIPASDRARVCFVRTDVTREADMENMIAAATREFGRLDVVINNAGAPASLSTVIDMPVEEWDVLMALTLRSVMLGIKHGARVLRAQGRGGVILATGSVAANAGGCGPIAYATAKAGVINLIRHAAVELAPHRIRVNSISPGAIYTANFASSGLSPEQIAACQPWPAAGMPADVANVALFLASDSSGFVTGSDYLVDGGLTALGPHLFKRLFGAM